MGRIFGIAMVLYGAGHPALDSMRPARLDRTLQALHREVNQAITDSRRTLAMLDDARSMRYLARTGLVSR